MNSLLTTSRPLVFFLCFSFLCYSCSVYHSKSISLDEAVATGKKVKIETSEDKLVFKRLKKIDSDYFGLAKKGSSTAKKLGKIEVIGRMDGKYYSFPLESLVIEEINSKNYPVSTLLTGIAVVAGTFVVVFIAAAITFASSGFF
ncbi:hypothetical protein E0K83_04415 [Gramella sp. BOM4]|nr:hypothetical protein [Christiangramia bathymodioli]